MKKALPRFLVMAILAVFLTTSLSALAAENLLADPKFEGSLVGLGESGTGWSSFVSDTASIAPDSSARAGAVKIITGPDDIFKGPYQIVAIEGGKSYKLSAMVKTEGAGLTGPFYYTWDFFNGTDLNTSEDASIKQHPGTNDWFDFTIYITAPENKSQITFCVLVGGEGTTWVADPVLIEIDPADIPTQGTDTSTDTSTGTSNPTTADSALIFIAAALLPISGLALLALRSKKSSVI